MKTFTVTRTWSELRREHVEIQAGSPERALEIAAEIQSVPFNGECVECYDVRLETEHEGCIYEREA